MSRYLIIFFISRHFVLSLLSASLNWAIIVEISFWAEFRENFSLKYSYSWFYGKTTLNRTPWIGENVRFNRFPGLSDIIYLKNKEIRAWNYILFKCVIRVWFNEGRLSKRNDSTKLCVRCIPWILLLFVFISQWGFMKSGPGLILLLNVYFVL